MAKNHIKYVLKNHIYRADAKDLGLTNTNQPHDVIVTSVNKRKKTCIVKTITSLENNNQTGFLQHKLNDVRNGDILVVPQDQIKTKHLSGIDHRYKKVKINKLYFSNTGTIFPRRYKHLIYKK